MVENVWRRENGKKNYEEESMLENVWRREYGRKSMGERVW